MIVNIILVALICGVNISNSTRPNNESGTPSSIGDLESRWLQLFDLLFEDSGSHALRPARVRSALMEMAELEKTIEIRGIESTHQDPLIRSSLSKYRTLVKSLAMRKILTSEEASLSSMLLQTFEIDSNNCYNNKMARLINLVHAMRSYPIQSTVMNNLENQYEACWARYMQALDLLTSILGERDLKVLIELTKRVHNEGETTLLLKNLADLADDERDAELRRYTKLIARFVLRHFTEQNGKMPLNLEGEFNRLLREPCEAFESVAEKLMRRIYKLMDTTGTRFMTKDHANMLNLYRLCSRIIKDINLGSRIAGLLSTHSMRRVKREIVHNPQIINVNESSTSNTSMKPKEETETIVDASMNLPGQKQVYKPTKITKDLLPTAQEHHNDLQNVEGKSLEVEKSWLTLGSSKFVPTPEVESMAQDITNTIEPLIFDSLPLDSQYPVREQANDDESLPKRTKID